MLFLAALSQSTVQQKPIKTLDDLVNNSAHRCYNPLTATVSMQIFLPTRSACQWYKRFVIYSGLYSIILPRHLHLLPEGGGMIKTPWSPSYAMG